MKIIKAMTVGTVAATLALAPPLAVTVAAQTTTGTTTMERDVSVEQVQEKISKAFDAISDYSVDQRDEAVDSIRDTLAQLDEEIFQLESDARNNWANMSEDERKEMSADLRELRTQRNTLGEHFGAMQEGSDSTWDEMKAGIADAWASVKEAWDNAVGSDKME
ncbi:hypothetical protein [Sneathiella sp.]|uniref:hypothetical protein n=1 Tax=Sneathiella sp. TaxID=1964365 RepID=UPI002FE37BF9